MAETPKVCLTIAGLDPSGGAGVVADIKTFAAFGCFPTAAVTSVTFQNTQGVFGAVHQEPDSVRRQLEPIADDYEIAALKTGMLPSREIIEVTAAFVTGRKLKNLVVDPVVRSTSGFDLIDDAALRSLIENLFPLADLITPNLPEAERIAGFAIRSDEDISRAAAIMKDLGARAVLIKGGHWDSGQRTADGGQPKKKAIDYLFLRDEMLTFSQDYIDSTATHGTGCVLSAAIPANLALGESLHDAVKIAKEFVTEGIRSAPVLGGGHSPVNVRLFRDR